MRRIFIGDIHGEIQELERVLRELRVTGDDEVVFLGDYIDKGGNSKAVLDRLILFKEEFPKTQFLWGNHELLFYQWIAESNPTFIDTTDGVRTLGDLVGNENIFTRMGEVYKNEDGEMKVITSKVKDEVWGKYGDFLRGLKYLIEYDEHVAVHGGLNFMKEDPIKETTNNEKVYIKGFINGSPLGKKIIVGHTPMDEVSCTQDGKVIAVDTGSGIGGKLSALVYYKGLDMYVNDRGNKVEKIEY